MITYNFIVKGNSPSDIVGGVNGFLIPRVSSVFVGFCG
jgi:hypothetical protein